MIVYKKTLTISIGIFFLFAVISVMLNFWNDYEWITFIINWCVGIACSAFVVMITTYIQYRIKKYKITIEIASESLVWLHKLYNLMDLVDESNELKKEELEKISSKYIEAYTENTHKCLSISCEYATFSKKSSEAAKNINYVFVRVFKLCTSKEYDGKPLNLIQKIKCSIDIMGFLKDLDVLLKPQSLLYIKENLNELIKEPDKDQVG